MVLVRVVLAALSLCFAAAASAQEGERRDPRAAYDAQVEELAGVLGGAHYLRILCTGRSDQRWRDFMRGVISREEGRARALTDAFNDGYRREEARFSECDGAARSMEAELRAQGLRLADGLSAWNGADQR
jgi:uncharacterized protein (TIGR02301 family)